MKERPRLRHIHRLITLPATALVFLMLQGCASISQEDKEFYYSGWLTPKTEPGENQFYRNFFFGP